jgi:GDP-mannose 6-dehydrogenase
MDLVCRDTQLNLSKAYLKPGFAFGGSCLPKDLRATLYLAKTHDVELPMLGAILSSIVSTSTMRLPRYFSQVAARSE